MDPVPQKTENSPIPEKKITMDPTKVTIWIVVSLVVLAIISSAIYIYMATYVYQSSPQTATGTPTPSISPTATLTPTVSTTPSITATPSPTPASQDTVNNLTKLDNIRSVSLNAQPITNPNDWKTYTSTRLNYTVEVPNNYDVAQFETVPDASTQDLNSSMKIGTNPNAFNQCADGATMQINYPIQMAPPHVDSFGSTLENGFEGLIITNYPNTKSFDNYLTTISNFPAFTTQIVTLDTVSSGNPCGMTTTTYYIDLKNNSILPIFVTYNNTQTQYIPIILQILSSLKFN